MVPWTLRTWGQGKATVFTLQLHPGFRSSDYTNSSEIYHKKGSIQHTTQRASPNLVSYLSVHSLISELYVSYAGSSTYKYQMYIAFSFRETHYLWFLKCICTGAGRMCLFSYGNICDKTMVIFHPSTWKYTPRKLHSPGLDFKLNIFGAIQSHKTLKSLWRWYLCYIHNFEPFLLGISIVNIVLFVLFPNLSNYPWGRVIYHLFTF